MTDTIKTTLALGQLRLSPLNVRKVEPTGIEALADDIAAHGLIQNLGVYREGKHYMVFAGGRRLRALQLLKQRKVIDTTYEVAVSVRDKTEAVELSIAENAQRENMHPADAVRAFGALRDNGLSASDIAARFGYSNGHVARLLKLAGLAPELLDALAADRLQMAAAQALAISDDHTAQIEAFERHGNHVQSIKRDLTLEKVAMKSREFRFIGLEAYQAAGGTVTRDLFGNEDDGFADCPDILDELVTAKLGAIRADLEAEGWKKVEVLANRPEDFYSHPKLSPVSREMTEDEAVKLRALENRIEELEAEGDSEELDALLDEQDAFMANLEGFTTDQKANGWVCAFIDYDGDIAVAHWRIRPDKATSEDEGESAAPAGPYSGAMIQRLTGIRTLALQQAVADQPALALDILLDTLARQTLHLGYGGQVADIVFRPAKIDVEDDLLDGSEIKRVTEIMVDRFADIPAEDRFKTIQAMRHEDKMAMLATMVAITLDATIPSQCHPGDRQSQADEYAIAANLDLAAVWSARQPFFDRLTKSGLLTILGDECGANAAEACAKMKKGDLAVTVNERLPSGWLPAPARSFNPVPKQPTDEGETLSEVA